MDYFKVPYGINKSGEVVPAKDAKKGECYSCISCSGELIFKAGEIREKHFSHVPNNKCNPETIIHLLAKKLIVKAIQDNAEGKSIISMNLKCSKCSKDFIKEIPKLTFSKAAAEVPISGFICDAIAYRDKKEALAIEIFHTHRVDDHKGEYLQIPWVEFNADEIIEDPFFWNPINSMLQPIFCNKCKNIHQYITTIAKKWGIDLNIFTTEKSPESGKYIAEVVECYNCKNEIPVFWWSGIPFSQDKPPDPMPYTIKYKYSKQYGGSYFMNTCPNCKVTQGDNFLFLQDDAPFKGLPIKKGNNPQLNRNSGGISIESAVNKLLGRNW
jgi:hypothetical protein